MIFLFREPNPASTIRRIAQIPRDALQPTTSRKVFLNKPLKQLRVNLAQLRQALRVDVIGVVTLAMKDHHGSLPAFGVLHHQ